MVQTEELEATINNLHDKNDYKFRVAAVNDIGQGPWADLGPITCKSPHGRSSYTWMFAVSVAHVIQA